MRGCVEDSATAEISRSQVWQWIRQGAVLEETKQTVTVDLVVNIVKRFVEAKDKVTREAAEIFLDIVTMKDFPEFITSLLNDSHEFRKSQHSLISLSSR